MLEQMVLMEMMVLLESKEMMVSRYSREYRRLLSSAFIIYQLGIRIREGQISFINFNKSNMALTSPKEAIVALELTNAALIDAVNVTKANIEAKGCLQLQVIRKRHYYSIS
jgi:hypothetical protein